MHNFCYFFVLHMINKLFFKKNIYFFGNKNIKLMMSEETLEFDAYYTFGQFRLYKYEFFVVDFNNLNIYDQLNLTYKISVNLFCEFKNRIFDGKTQDIDFSIYSDLYTTCFEQSNIFDTPPILISLSLFCKAKNLFFCIPLSEQETQKPILVQMNASEKYGFHFLDKYEIIGSIFFHRHWETIKECNKESIIDVIDSSISKYINTFGSINIPKYAYLKKLDKTDPLYSCNIYISFMRFFVLLIVKNTFDSDELYEKISNIDKHFFKS